MKGLSLDTESSSLVEFPPTRPHREHCALAGGQDEVLAWVLDLVTGAP